MPFKHLCLGLLLSCGLASSATALCSEDQFKLRWDNGAAQFSVEVRDTFDERAEGLMFRESLPRFSGMLFVYDVAQPVAFWMRNTKIPLDMLFFNARGVLQRIHKNAVPLDETSIPGGNDIQYVLEINGGLSDTLGIKVGAQAQHPALRSAKTAWPCPAVE